METFSGLLAICAGNSPVSGELSTQRPVTQSFDVFFDLRLNKRLSKQSWAGLGRVPDLPVRVLVICVSTSTSPSTWLLHESESESESWLLSTSTSTSTGLYSYEYWSMIYILYRQ